MLLQASATGISSLEFITDGETDSLEGIDRNIASTIRNAADYIAGRNVRDDINLLPDCTDFQFSVFRALMQIPCGTTVSYKDIAAAIGQPRAVRAVGHAIASNRIALLIPCHRVVPASGGCGNYRWGASLKRTLIEDERQSAKKLPAN